MSISCISYFIPISTMDEVWKNKLDTTYWTNSIYKLILDDTFWLQGDNITCIQSKDGKWLLLHPSEENECHPCYIIVHTIPTRIVQLCSKDGFIIMIAFVKLYLYIFMCVRFFNVICNIVLLANITRTRRSRQSFAYLEILYYIIVLPLKRFILPKIIRNIFSRTRSSRCLTGIAEFLKHFFDQCFREERRMAATRRLQKELGDIRKAGAKSFREIQVRSCPGIYIGHSDHSPPPLLRLNFSPD